jgi:hydroxypyruvate isomerase
VNWTLRYASHLGYKPPEIGLSQESAGSDDPVEQIDFAAEQGFAGVQYARAVTRSGDERKHVRRANNAESTICGRSTNV